MRLNVEISASTNSWDDEKLRRRLKWQITDAVNEVIGDFDRGELHSLKLVKPAPRRTTKKASA